MQVIAQNVALVPTLISNCYLVGDADAWVLVDALTPGHTGAIERAVEERFGKDARPRAIVLTHGHFDHAGSAGNLARKWDVRVFAHQLELPYLDHRSSYPPLDPTAPGFFSAMARLFPSGTVNLSGQLAELDFDHPFPGLDDWTCIQTPGHSPGHVSFFHRGQEILLAGDAVTTMNLDSLTDTLAKREQVCRPPVPGTTDWRKARDSVRTLAQLQPKLIAAGHGFPMHNAAAELQRLADYFPMPDHGRYAVEPALADETGVTYLPPRPFDPVRMLLTGVAAATVIGAVVRSTKRRER